MSIGNYVEGVNPQIIKWAREKSGYSIDEVSEKLKKDSEIIMEWESGKSIPTYSQLENLAYKIYKRPIAIFFFPEPPIEDDLSESFRTMPNIEIDSITPHVRYLIREGKFTQITLSELNNHLNPANNRIFDDIQIDINDNVENVSIEIRNYLGIDIQKQEGWASNREALKNWRDSIEKTGVFIFKNAFKQNDISGFCLYDDEFPIIYLNNSNSLTRQIFSIFHELCHLLLGKNGITKNSLEYLSLLKGEDLRIEVYCNKFASECLVPSNDFNSRLNNIQVSEETINEFSNLYHVSREVIMRKMLDRKMISISDYEKYSELWNREYLRSKKGSSGGNYYATKLVYFGENYLNLLFKKRYEGKVTNEQIAQNLNMKIQNIPKLEQLLLERHPI